LVLEERHELLEMILFFLQSLLMAVVMEEFITITVELMETLLVAAAEELMAQPLAHLVALVEPTETVGEALQLLLAVLEAEAVLVVLVQMEVHQPEVMAVLEQQTQSQVHL
jgi:hypothetical protein|tara:strand:+ start:75 stop:407 length:333 start_codon:yes stop_codon:yes gene_type:complete